MFKDDGMGQESISKKLLDRTVSSSPLTLVLNVTNPDDIYRLAYLTSSPIRLKILYYIKKYGELSIKELSELLNIAPPIVSRHVKKLEEQGLVISGVRIGRRGLLKVVRRRYEEIIIKL